MYTKNTNTTPMSDRQIGRQAFMSLNELPADASAEMLEGWAEAEAEMDDYLTLGMDQGNGDF